MPRQFKLRDKLRPQRRLFSFNVVKDNSVTTFLEDNTKKAVSVVEILDSVFKRKRKKEQVVGIFLQCNKRLRIK